MFTALLFSKAVFYLNLSCVLCLYASSFRHSSIHQSFNHQPIRRSSIYHPATIYPIIFHPSNQHPSVPCQSIYLSPCIRPPCIHESIHPASIHLESSRRLSSIHQYKPYLCVIDILFTQFKNPTFQLFKLSSSLLYIIDSLAS